MEMVIVSAAATIVVTLTDASGAVYWTALILPANNSMKAMKAVGEIESFSDRFT
jgi:hypothetical protein